MVEIPSPPGKIDDVAAKFVPTDALEIVGMEGERDLVAIVMHEAIYPGILKGHTGLAKTKLIERIHQDAGWPYRTVGGRDSLEVDNLVGKWIATKAKGMEYKLGILPFCMKHGISLGLQEINATRPEVLILLHEFADEGRITLDELDPEHEDFIIEPGPNFRLFGTMNPPELYPGVRDLSPAFVRRCLMKTVNPLPPAQEVEVLKIHAPHLSEADAEQMVGVANDARDLFPVQCLFWFSTADLVMWAQAAKHMPPYEAAVTCVIGKTQTERDAQFVLARIRQGFSPVSELEEATL